MTSGIALTHRDFVAIRNYSPSHWLLPGIRLRNDGLYIYAYNRREHKRRDVKGAITSARLDYDATHGIVQTRIASQNGIDPPENRPTA